MKRKGNRKGFDAAALLLAVAAIGLVFCFAAGMGRSVRVFDNLITGGLDFGGAVNKTFSLANGTQYGILNSGPNYALPAGKYKLTWTTECDAPNGILITSSNGARIEPKKLTIDPNCWTDSASFTLLDDAENVQIQFCFEAGSVLKLHDVQLSFSCTDGLWLAAFALAACAVLWGLYKRGWLTAERKRMLLLIGAAVLIASVPALRENLNAGHDSEFHRMRLRNVVSALMEGQFPVRVGGYMYNGYGGAASIFYPDLCLYLPALLMIGGATIQFALSAMIVAINAVTALTAYLCGKRMFGDRQAGVCSAVLYTLASYRLTDVYTRMALGEAAAMAVIPLFFLGLWEVVFGDKKRWPVLVLGATAVFQTHMISTVLCALMAVLICGACLVRMIREKRMAALLLAALVTALINAFSLVPLLDYMLSGISMGTLNSSVSAGAMKISELFARNPEFPRDLGHALLLGAVAASCALVGQQEREAKLARLLLGAGFVMAFMATDLFPWAMVERRFGALVNFLQFPWRLLMFADIFLALACGYGVTRFCGEEKWKEMAALAVLAVCVITSSAQIEKYTVEENHSDRYWLSNSDMIAAYGEYTLPGTNVARTLYEHDLLIEGDVQVTGYEKKGTRAEVDLVAQQGGSVTLPVFAFDGYAAELDGQRLDIARGDNNRMLVDIPAGTNGTLRIWFEGKMLWRAADAISLLAIIGLTIYWYRRKTRRRGYATER